MKRGALPLCRANDLRPPKPKPAIMRIKQLCCPIGKFSPVRLGVRQEERRHSGSTVRTDGQERSVAPLNPITVCLMAVAAKLHPR